MEKNKKLNYMILAIALLIAFIFFGISLFTDDSETDTKGNNNVEVASIPTSTINEETLSVEDNKEVVYCPKALLDAEFTDNTRSMDIAFQSAINSGSPTATIYPYHSDLDSCEVDYISLLNNILIQHGSEIGMNPDDYKISTQGVLYLSEGNFIISTPYKIFQLNIFKQNAKNILEVQPSTLEVVEAEVFHFESSAYLVYTLRPYGLGCGDEESCNQLEKSLKDLCKTDTHGLWLYDYKTGKHKRLEPATFGYCD